MGFGECSGSNAAGLEIWIGGLYKRIVDVMRDIWVDMMNTGMRDRLCTIPIVDIEKT